MRRSIYTYAVSALLLTVTGCRKYVEIGQPGERVLQFTEDYDALLNNVQDMNSTYFFPWAACDDIEVTDVTLEQRITGTVRQTYTWADNLWGDGDDFDWTRLYKQVYNCNQVVESVMDSEGGSEARKRTIVAKAKMYRAFAYLDLVNMYAKHYDNATSATDPGVPLLLRPVFEVSLKRASVKTVYEQITKDLLEAIPYLPELPGQLTEPSRSGAYALLAREHLYMGLYEDARKYADSALDMKNSLLDLSNYANGEVYPNRYNHPETYFNRVLGSGSMTFYPLSPALQSLFTPTDLRWQIYTRDGKSAIPFAFTGRAYWRNWINFTDGTFVGLDVPEMMLTKAECLARAGNTTEAMTLINTLRQKRFKPVDYTALTAADANEALRIVLDERRREMMGRAHRLFDQKRLNKEAAFAKTVTRTFLGETYTLQPNDDKYVFPIANKYILLNPEIEQNPR